MSTRGIRLRLRIALYALFVPWRLRRDSLEVLARGIPLAKERAGGPAEAVLAAADAVVRRRPFVWALFPKRCLLRSLLLHRFLRLEGHDSELSIGVSRTAEDGLEAHAWVSLQGRPFGEPADPRERYRVLYKSGMLDSASSSLTSSARSRSTEPRA